ncbi:MAG: hypothetical protein A2381_09080 [Bdellovibrionales bacterium RIFOXYB1_FULL_37_110]|nr:MAG: hypothetical protein A2181_09270 [Bdellovibrionales bacterium RIFOXYA1_FULL_38_20]OFZ46423.1 MAG: hypothetical protein A2417_09180 [Bdellovibrionales bacterium RIFOXYC1_FULL_37_79]OFZ54088.1 MAG: hypothetical protein A2328_11440 [Bdellovibrionales bacterium RIFOXYB2_FULL_36_6]OFZ60987.1 MAG: hypothetical protein A2381_09080 [Bdellovibrionales bacterium RIFOXYB1_FULL_37_110]OFZ63731.1 MAG: hypothetical protein A2577_08200 [Bdellovibrionales bacterium RIFOXYD1_FULL_36_51]
MNEISNESVWLSIFEYSKKTGKSISTIRRYIKAKRIVSQMIDGKFYLLVDANRNANEQVDYSDCQKLKLEKQVVFLKKQLVAVQEEISELKMLVNLYERQTVLKNTASGCNQPENNIQ